MKAYFASFATPLGRFAVAVNEDRGVIGAAFGDESALLSRLRGLTLERATARLLEVQRQLGEYFAGERRDFELALAPAGTSFQQDVWRALCQIPYGETRSYAEIAARLGSAPRAVGAANGANPVCLIIPCHRVVGADGSLTGYAYGIEKKQALLNLEKRFAPMAMSLVQGVA